MAPAPFLTRAAATLASGAGKKLLILTYHRIMARHDPLLPGEADVDAFRVQLGVLCEGWTVLPLAEAAARLRSGDLPPRAACITFDDGYASNSQLGLPVLQEAGLPATFFVATGFLDGGRMFNDTVIEVVRRLPDRPDLTEFGWGKPVLDSFDERHQLIVRILRELRTYPPDTRNERVERFAATAQSALPDDLMMTRSEVAGLAAAGMEVGAHTVNHPILSNVSPAEARAEIETSIAELEAITGARIRSFAYPNGKPGRDYGAEHVRIVADCGLEYAVSTAHGTAGAGSDPLQLPRISVWGRTPGKFALRLLRACLSGQEERA